MYNHSIASERKRLGITQEELAKRLNLTRSTVARWESDPEIITGKYLIALSDLFNCSADYLLGRTNERSPSRI